MPLYEYNCSDCKTEFELLIRREEQPECPDCGGRRLTKRFSVPAAHSGRGGALPLCEVPSAGTCGLPQCGTGDCQMGF